MPRLKRSAPKSAKKERVREELHKFKKGTLKSSSGDKVKDRKQAIAIALSESGQSKKKKSPFKPKAAHSSKRPRNKGRG